MKKRQAIASGIPEKSFLVSSIKWEVKREIATERGLCKRLFGETI